MPETLLIGRHPPVKGRPEDCSQCSMFLGHAKCAGKGERQNTGIFRFCVRPFLCIVVKLLIFLHLWTVRGTTLPPPMKRRLFIFNPLRRTMYDVRT